MLMLLHKILRMSLIMMLLNFLSACSVFGPVKNPEIHQYALEKTSTRVFGCHAHNATIVVNLPSAVPPYQTSDMYYSTSAYQVSRFANNRWVAPPANMLQPLIVQGLKNSGCFRAVVAGPFWGNTQYRLQSQLVQLKQKFICQSSVTQLILHATLVNVPRNKIVWDKRLVVSCAAPTPDPRGGVIAANNATAQLISDLVAGVILHLQ